MSVEPWTSAAQACGCWSHPHAPPHPTHSAVDELAAQIRLEFDFQREARIMDAVARQFQVCVWRWGWVVWA